MSEDFILNAEERNEAGKGASRRLRRLADQVPAIVYGEKKEPQLIAIPHKDLLKALESEAFYSHIISIRIGEHTEDVLLKDLQRHPAKPRILHADFLRVNKNKKVIVKSPLHFINQDKCYGVKQEGGLIQHAVTELEISCLPNDLPDFIEVDMTKLKVGDNLHVSDLKLPKGVESVALAHDHDLQVAAVVAPKGGLAGGEGAEGETGTSAEETKKEGGED